MSRFTFVVDLDGVVLNYVEHLAARRIAAGYPPPPPPTRYNMVEPGWFTSMEEWRNEHRAAVTEGMYAKLRPYRDASRVLTQLHDEGAYIKLATARGLDSQTRAWEYSTTILGLERANIPFDELHFTEDKWSVEGDVYIEDSPCAAREFAVRGLRFLVFSHAYNASSPGLRVATWLDVPRALLHAGVPVDWNTAMDFTDQFDHRAS